MAEGVLYYAVPVAPELVFERMDHGGARVDGLLELRVDIGDNEVNGHRRTAERLGCRRLAPTHFREVVVEHHRRPVDPEGGVDQLAVRTGHPAMLDRAERLHVEIDRGCG